MAQGEFTKEEAQEAMNVFMEIVKAHTRNKKIKFFVKINDVMLFLEAAKMAAPAEGE